MLLLVTVSVLLAAPVEEQHGAPFVVGFERFYRAADRTSPTGGRLLLSELSCTACHAVDDADLRAKRGPDLSGAGTRLREEWIRDYLLAPGTIKPDGTMPEMLHGFSGPQKRRAATALAAYLSSLKKAFPSYNSTAGNPIAPQFWRKGDQVRGGRLYHQVGCVACHAADPKYETGGPVSQLQQLIKQLEPDELRELGLGQLVLPVKSIPLGRLPKKYSRKALVHFLLAPEQVRPAGRMPNLLLRPQEAADIAAFLLPQADLAPAGLGHKQDVARQPVEAGRKLFAQLRCANCHDAEQQPRRAAQPLEPLRLAAEASCIGEATEGMPHFALDAQQRRAIRRAAPTEGQQEVTTASDRVHLRMLQRNCYACHQRAKRGGIAVHRQRYFETVGNADLGDEGRLPPALDGVGRKLKESWLGEVLKGTGAVRPHLQIRMPKFVGLEPLPAQLVLADGGGSPPSAKQVFGDFGPLAGAGRSLLDTGCVQCHPLRGEQLPGVLGIDLQQLQQRIQPQWFHDFLRNPSQLKPRTRMPTFFPKGKSASPQILNGDVERQIASMWAYLRQLDKQPLPEKLLAGRTHNFELSPSDRPLLLRTFMKRAGTHAIAVGFPEEVHIAFDAMSVRVAEAWRGRFLDAHGTWFDRFTPLASPLGEEIIAFPPGPTFALLDDDKQPWPTDDEADANGQVSPIAFRGYRIGKTGVPTFLYRFRNFLIEDRLEPRRQSGRKVALHRRLSIQSTKQDANASERVWMRFLAGPGEVKKEGAQFALGGLAVTLPSAVAERVRIRKNQKQAECIAPFTVNGTTRIEVDYQW